MILGTFSRVLAGLPLLALASAAANEKLINMPANTWMEVAGTQMESVCFKPAPKDQPCTYVTKAWNGGVYDQVDRKMLVWGGGHGDYYGNEVYAFNTETLKWERLTNPSSGVVEGMDPLPDGQPVSRHTYDGLSYVAHKGRMLAYGGATAGAGNGTSVTWAFDAATKAWENRKAAGGRPGGNECCEFSSDYDPVTKKVYLKEPNYIWSYDFELNAWKQLLEWPMNGDPRKSKVDPTRGILFTIGSGDFQAYDIKQNKNVTSAWATTGGGPALASYGPGMDYDWNADKMVAWVGGGPWALDMKTRQWTQMSGTGAPAKGEDAGTYGRWRYLEQDNVFILVNTVTQNVYFYKHTAGPGVLRNTVEVKDPRRGAVRPGAHPEAILSGRDGAGLRDARGVRIVNDKGAPAASGAYIVVPGPEGESRGRAAIRSLAK